MQKRTDFFDNSLLSIVPDIPLVIRNKPHNNQLCADLSRLISAYPVVSHFLRFAWQTTNTRFTIEEENIVAIYAEDSRETTLENILAAMPYMDEDMRQLAAAAVNKLQAMTDSEFSEREFILTDEE